MNAESPWDPEQLGRLTITQLECLSSKEPPGEGEVLESAADFERALARIEAEEREWHARPI